MLLTPTMIGAVLACSSARRSRPHFCSNVIWIPGQRLCRESFEDSVLLLLPKYLPVGLAVRIKAIMFAPFPGGFQFGPGDVPVRATFLQRSSQILPKLFDGRSTKKPVAIVDFEYNETRLEDNYMRDHRIVLGVRVLGDVEILLNLAPRIG